MRIILSGYGGHMGREVRACAERMEDARIVAGVDPMAPVDDICVKSIADCKTEADVIIDFSHHSGTGALLEYAIAKKLPVVLATTGQTEEEKAGFGAADRPRRRRPGPGHRGGDPAAAPSLERRRAPRGGGAASQA